MHLDGFQEQVLIASFDTDRLNLGKLAIVIFNFSLHPRLRNNSCLFHKGLSSGCCHGSAPVRL